MLSWKCLSDSPVPCRACQSFNALRHALRSAKGVFLPLTPPQKETKPLWLSVRSSSRLRRSYRTPPSVRCPFGRSSHGRSALGSVRGNGMEEGDPARPDVPVGRRRVGKENQDPVCRRAWDVSASSSSSSTSSSYPRARPREDSWRMTQRFSAHSQTAMSGVSDLGNVGPRGGSGVRAKQQVRFQSPVKGVEASDSSGRLSDSSGNFPGHSKNVSGHSGNSPGNFRKTLGHPGSFPGHSGHLSTSCSDLPDHPHQVSYPATSSSVRAASSDASASWGTTQVLRAGARCPGVTVIRPKKSSTVLYDSQSGKGGSDIPLHVLSLDHKFGQRRRKIRHAGSLQELEREKDTCQPPLGYLLSLRRRVQKPCNRVTKRNGCAQKQSGEIQQDNLSQHLGKTIQHQSGGVQDIWVHCQDTGTQYQDTGTQYQDTGTQHQDSRIQHQISGLHWDRGAGHPNKDTISLSANSAQRLQSQGRDQGNKDPPMGSRVSEIEKNLTGLEDSVSSFSGLHQDLSSEESKEENLAGIGLGKQNRHQNIQKNDDVFAPVAGRTAKSVAKDTEDFERNLKRSALKDQEEIERNLSKIVVRDPEDFERNPKKSASEDQEDIEGMLAKNVLKDQSDVQGDPSKNVSKDSENSSRSFGEPSVASGAKIGAKRCKRRLLGKNLSSNTLETKRKAFLRLTADMIPSQLMRFLKGSEDRCNSSSSTTSSSLSSRVSSSTFSRSSSSSFLRTTLSVPSPTPSSQSLCTSSSTLSCTSSPSRSRAASRGTSGPGVRSAGSTPQVPQKFRARLFGKASPVVLKKTLSEPFRSTISSVSGGNPSGRWLAAPWAPRHALPRASTPVSSAPLSGSVDTRSQPFSVADESWCSHRGYQRTPTPDPLNTAFSGVGDGGTTLEGIPWITTPPKGNPGVLEDERGVQERGRQLRYCSSMVEGGDGNDEVKWDRSNSLRKPFHRTRTSSSNHDPTAAAALSDTELSKISVSLLDVEGGGSETSERAIDVGPVGAWATSFEKLLEDPAGLHTFAEFLKKEFSHENIYFWTACERYKRLSDQEERRSMAKTIFERHLCIGASEPVNVDSHARQVAQEGLHSPDEFLFEQAEKQIFNLMKFDSYSRFLKSNLYKDCMACDLRGQPLPYPGDDTLDPDLRISQDDSHIKLKKSKSDADERRRKSLLPWHRKDRSKSKDRGEAEYRRRKNLLSRGTNNSDSSSIRSDVTGSRTSLNSSDLALVTRHAVSRESLTSGEIGSLSGSEGYNLCRVMLPDLSNSVVAVRPGEAVRTLLTRLLDRRGLNYSTYDVFYHKGDKPVDQTEDSSVLGGQEVRVEQRVLFRLDLPSRKTVCVKAKPHKISQDVLKPILHKYGYKLDLMAIHKAGEEKNINLKGPVTELDNEKFVVQTKEGIKEWGVECGRTYKKRTNTLDEITNRVFEDLLKGKLEQNFDELGVLDFDTRSNKTDRSSDRSSSILGSFSRRNSLAPEKETKPRKPGNRSSVHEGGGVGRGMVGVAGADGKVVNVQAKRRGTTQTNSKQENDGNHVIIDFRMLELYEGLKRAQRSRLDDQRGTEINFELPDFLKCDQQQDKENQHTHITDQLFAHFDCSFGENGVIPSHHEAEEYFSMAHPEVWGGVPVSALNSRGSSTGVNGRRSANATLIAAELEFDDLDVTLRDDPLCQVLPEPTSSHVEQLDFVPPPLLSDENLPSSSTAALLPPPPSSLLLSPPPLPPKPKLAALRGPPPRPPSRQLHLIHPPTFSSTSDDEPNPHIPTKHIVQQPQDKFNISFV
ncbi:regulator of G protein signaling family member locomotion defects isoform X7 [Oratosquilla oratoria]|uniref:regulator of G protein signaling family member locomotion defects isoform X7 n=1 Tax=Oratosquilla oratoria TaxID=337810 RepID=UPI003F76F925